MMKDNDNYSQYISEEELYKIRTSKYYDGYDYDGPKQIRKEVEPGAFKMKEEFKILPENPRYVIGNEGSVYDRKTGHRLTPTSRDSDIVNSYQIYNLEGVGIRYAHRLTAQMFLPDYNDPGKEVNHKYGNKRLNRVVDLDMKTPAENVQHAHDNDLIGSELNHLKAEKSGIQQNHTEKEIRDICELICQGYSDMDIRSIIMSKYQFLNYSAGFIKVLRYCSPIYQPAYWKIVKEYVDRFPNRRYRKFTDQDIEEFCKMLDKGMTSSQIAEALGIPDNSELRTTLSGLRSGLIYTDISSKYKNIQKIQRTRLSLEEADKIYVLAMKGYNSKEIAKMVGMEPSQSFATTVSQLRKGSIFGEIKQKYENTVFEQERAPKYSNDTVRNVCDMLSNRISVRRIAETTGYSIGEIRKLANDIITKSKYTEISSRYPNIGPLSKKLPIETVEKIYLLSTEGKRPAEIANILGIPMSHTFSGTVSKIRSGKSYPEVKEKYRDIEMPKFTSANHPNPISPEQAEKIYLLYNDGSKPSEISSILGIQNTPNFRSSVHRIVHGKMYPEVYKKYNK